MMGRRQETDEVQLRTEERKSNSLSVAKNGDRITLLELIQLLEIYSVYCISIDDPKLQVSQQLLKMIAVPGVNSL
jgi:hypothetical protein